VIAVGGDTLSITASGVVSVNGTVLDEPYIQGETVLFDFPGTTKVPSGYLFVMGDNRSMSKDSRKTEIGLISIKDVVGKAVYRVWPLQSFGKIE
jgi:signal peptidase I